MRFRETPQECVPGVLSVVPGLDIHLAARVTFALGQERTQGVGMGVRSCAQMRAHLRAPRGPPWTSRAAKKTIA